MKPTKEDIKESREFLLKNLPPNTKVYTICRHVSRSGMMRIISLIIIIDGEPYEISWHIDKLGLFSRKYPNNGLTVYGCGMDMGFHVVYELGRVLYPDGFPEPCTKCGHPKTDEWELGMCPAGQCTFRGRNGDTSGYETDGGYALNHKWL
jgi:hypothetical protein